MGAPWAKQDDSILLKAYSLGLANKEIQKQFLPHRTILAIRWRVSKVHNLKCNPEKFWTKQEDEKLLEAYSLGLTNREIHEQFLPNKTIRAIGEKLRRDYKLSSNTARNKPINLYVVYFPTEDVYKIGITTTTIHQRMIKSSFPKNYEIIFLEQFLASNSMEAKEKEKFWLKNVDKYKIKDKIFKAGNTEIIRI